MRINKIAIMAILVIFAIVLAGSESAFDLSSLNPCADNGSEDITVGGIGFYMPDGFTENEEYKMENESGSVNPDVTMSAAGFEDSTKDNAIYILVANYGQSNNTTEKVVKLAQTMDGKAKTINGHQGYLGEQTNDQAAAMNMTQGTVYSFVYEDNGNLVSITATNETYFNEVIPK